MAHKDFAVWTRGNRCVSPQLNLYNYKWPILANQGNFPPAKTVFDDDDRRGVNIDSYVCAGCITSGGTVRRSILGPLTKINSYSLVEDSILGENVTIGRHAKIRRAIIDKNVVVADGEESGYDHDQDRAKGYTVTDWGIVVVPRRTSSSPRPSGTLSQRERGDGNLAMGRPGRIDPGPAAPPVRRSGPDSRNRRERH